jgi:WD40 repeat protein
VHPDGRLAFTGAWYAWNSRLWEWPTARALGIPTDEHQGQVVAAEFTPDGAALLTLDTGPEIAGGRVRWWRVANDDLAPDPRPWPPLTDVTAFALPRRGAEFVLVGHRTGRAEFRSAATGEPVGPELSHPSAVTAAAVIPDGRLAAIGCRDGGVWVWSAPDGRPVSGPFYHADRVNAVAMADGANGAVVATASDDGTVRVWDVRTGLPLGPPLRHGAAALCVAFAPDGSRTISGSRDGKVLAWSMPEE